MHIPSNLAPGALQKIIPLKVIRSESFPDTHEEDTLWQGAKVAIHSWLDHVETSLTPEISTKAGNGLCYQHENIRYLTGIPDATFISLLMETLLKEANLAVSPMAHGQRQRTGMQHVMTINYGLDEINMGPGNILDDQRILPTGGVCLKKHI